MIARVDKPLAPNIRRVAQRCCFNCKNQRLVPSKHGHRDPYCGKYKLIPSGNDWIRGMPFVCDGWEPKNG